MKSIQDGADCKCGVALPWHLFSLSIDRFEHVCLCERWYVQEAGRVTLEGRKPNPFKSTRPKRVRR